MSGEDFIGQLAAMGDYRRRRVLAQLTQPERRALLKQIEWREQFPLYQYRGDPVGFMEDGLGETAWSIPKDIMRSVVENKRTAVPACHAPGKLAQLDLPILTPDGWRAWGDLSVGDEVFDEGGNPVTVKHVTPVIRHPFYRVYFNDGTDIEMGAEHRWMALDAATRHRIRQREHHHGRQVKSLRDWWDEGREVTTEEMAVAVTVPNGKGTQANWAIPNAAPLTFPDRGLPVDPYTLGVWLGDGTTTQRNVTLNDQDMPHIIARMEAGGTRIGKATRQREDNCYRVGLPGAALPLGDKHIPEEYQTASIRQREALLHGLMDTDGWAQKGTNTASLGLSCERLFNDAVELIRGLGYAPRITTKTPHIDGKPYGQHWTATWHYDRPVFTLPRYGAPVDSAQMVRATTRYITKIEPIGDRLGRCIQVDSDRHLYVSGRQHIVTHNTHTAARIIAYWVSVHPPGTARVITTATTFRQVKGLLWPHIRHLHDHHDLMGRVTAVEWTMDGIPLAEGIKPPDDAEAGASGYHAPHLLIVVDEAGGIKRTFGQSLEALMTGIDTHMLVLGNPPVSGDTSWFESICSSPLYTVIPIPYTLTPNFTGERTDQCRACPPEVDPHDIAQHLIDVDWVENLRQEYGEDSAWFQARALARFVHESSDKTIPIDWIQASRELEDMGTGPIKLGCDIAADGGDEFAISRLDGWNLSIVHASKGEANASAPEVAAVILKEIRRAERDHDDRGIQERVRVKLDSIGVGWGVAGILKQWAQEGLFRAEIIPVNVAEKPGDPKKFSNQRAEMWWAMRGLLEPNRAGSGLLRLCIEDREQVQLNGPMYGANSTGKITIEKKADMRKRGIHSPDRAEALLLAVYEPPNAPAGILPEALVLGQANTWGAL